MEQLTADEIDEIIQFIHFDESEHTYPGSDPNPNKELLDKLERMKKQSGMVEDGYTDKGGYLMKITKTG